MVALPGVSFKTGVSVCSLKYLVRLKVSVQLAVRALIAVWCFTPYPFSDEVVHVAALRFVYMRGEHLGTIE